MPEFDLQSLLISPNRQLAASFLETVPSTRAFQILGDLKDYPASQALEMRLRQLEPDVVLLDLATDLGRASEIIARVVQFRPGTQVIGLHVSNEAEALIVSLRCGASEFLYVPFAPATQLEAIARVRRLLRPRSFVEREAGRVVCFAGAKSGSGSTTLAVELAMSLARRGTGRVLLIDGDLAGGTLSGICDPAPLPESPSLLTALSGGDAGSWHRQTARMGPIELLPAPAVAFAEAADLSHLQEVIETARNSYDWVVIDLPIITERISLMTAASADAFFLVTTGELPSLHLGRRAFGLLQSLGFAKNAIRILVNRTSKRDGLAIADLEKIFGARIEAMLPQDYQSIHRRITSPSGMCQPLGTASELGKAIDALAGQLAASEIKAISLPEPQPC